jgi:predicted  nucleic acid-binding Zn-ribbon protein
VDLQLKQTEDQLASIPARLASMQKDVAAVEALLDEERRQLGEVQAYRSELEELVQSQQTQLNKAKAKLTQVRTSKEYMAIQREFETNRRIVGEREQEIAKLTEAIASTTESIEKHEQELQELRSHVEDEEKETRSQVAQLEQRVQEQREGREQTATGIKKTLLRKYDQIRRMRDGLAVVEVVDGVCTGCRMQLAPQLYNMLQRCETIEQCPNCQRIVYYRCEEQDESSASDDESSASDQGGDNEAADSVTAPATTTGGQGSGPAAESSAPL